MPSYGGAGVGRLHCYSVRMADYVNVRFVRRLSRLALCVALRRVVEREQRQLHLSIALLINKQIMDDVQTGRKRRDAQQTRHDTASPRRRSAPPSPTPPTAAIPPEAQNNKRRFATVGKSLTAAPLSSVQTNEVAFRTHAPYKMY